MTAERSALTARVRSRLSTAGAPRVPPPAPFVVGAGRSGTTLLRLMLDAHRELALPSETHFVPELIEASRQPGATAETIAELLVNHRRWGDFGLEAETIRERVIAIRPFDVSDAIRAFYSAYAEKQGKPRWGDKTPRHVRSMRVIDRALTEARFIHMIRDGRDVHLSALASEPKPRSPAHHARRWKRSVRTARSKGERVRHYMEVRYEDLILDTEAQLRRICGFLELEFDSAMLRYYERAEQRLREIARPLPAGPDLPLGGNPLKAQSAEHRLWQNRMTREPPRADRVARWRTEMPAEDRAEYEAVVGGLLSELGYEIEPPRSAPAAQP